MSKKIHVMLLFLAVLSLLQSSAQKKLSIQTDPNNGAPGDVVQVKVRGGQVSKAAVVMIGKQRALTVSASDSAIAVMIPPMLRKGLLFF